MIGEMIDAKKVVGTAASVAHCAVQKISTEEATNPLLAYHSKWRVQLAWKLHKIYVE